MKVLVTGGSGQLGHDVVHALYSAGYDVLAPSHTELDIVSSDSVKTFFDEHHPDAVIHCAAWTAVDDAESHVEECRDVNVNGTENIVDACRMLSIPIVFISTDYVFDGTGSKPRRTVDRTCPINVYGASKRDGELITMGYPKHYIVRISWVFGMHGKNFVKTMIRLSKGAGPVRVVSDQVGSPTFTEDLAPLLIRIMESGDYGTYHAHNSGYCSWFDFATEIFRICESPLSVEPIPSSEFKTAALRPMNSRLDCSATDGRFGSLPAWDDALKRFIVQYRRSQEENKTS